MTSSRRAAGTALAPAVLAIAIAALVAPASGRAYADSPSPSGTTGVTGPLEEAIAHVQAGRLAQAKSALQALAGAAATAADANYWLGRVALSEGDADGAVERFETAVERAADRSEFHTWLGNAYFVQSESAGMFAKMSLARKMRKSWQQAIAVDPDNLEARDNLMRFYVIAPGIVGGDRDEAWKQAGEIERRDLRRGIEARAFLHENAGEMDKAEAVYREAVAKFPDDPRPLQRLGFFYQSKKDWPLAFDSFEKALEREPEDRTSLYQIGRTAVFSESRLYRGAECLEKYMTLVPGPGEPSHAWAQYRLGMVHGLAGRKDAARAAYRKTLELDPDHADAKKALESL